MSFSSRKTVYFIRHGESESNAKMKLAVDSFCGLASLTDLSMLNVAKFLASLVQLLLDSNEDSVLSDLGTKQACSVREYATAEFLKMKSDATDIRILYSNLGRAKNTAKCLLQSHFEEAEEVPLLQEATRFEHVFSGALLGRIGRFEKWLGSLEESVVVVVGHAQYFKKMLKHSSNIHNCDVWKVECLFTHQDDDSISSASVQWGVPTLQFRSPYSYQHPLNRFSFFYSDSSEDIPAFTSKRQPTMDDCGDVNDCGDNHNEEEDEVTCRICQMTASECSSEEVFIRPCKCMGTLSHVHINCLNEWRATSSSASYKCFTCNYTYRIERTVLSQFLMSERGTRAISVLLISVVTVLMGVVGICTSKWLFGLDLCLELCRVAHWRMWWHSCSFAHLPTLVHSFLNFWTELLFRRGVDHIRAVIFCNVATVMMMEIVLVGSAMLGMYGVVMFLLDEGQDIYRAFGQGRQDWQYLAFVACYIASLGSTNTCRLSIWLGFAVACRAAYFNIRHVGQRVAQSIGENILEPN